MKNKEQKVHKMGGSCDNIVSHESQVLEAIKFDS